MGCEVQNDVRIDAVVSGYVSVPEYDSVLGSHCSYYVFCPLAIVVAAMAPTIASGQNTSAAGGCQALAAWQGACCFRVCYLLCCFAFFVSLLRIFEEEEELRQAS